jgi:uncharacterized protein
MELLQSFGLSDGQWLIVLLTALFIGLAKTGLPGLATVMVPLMAHQFGGKFSTGMIVPMLLMADLFAVAFYRRHAEWKHLLKLLPWTFAGIIPGTITGNQIDDETFKSVMGVIIIISVVIMIWRDYRGVVSIPGYWWFAILMGLAAGFSTMVGNLAGAVTALYFLSMRMPKNAFIGTGAWFYLLVNLFKVPFHVFSWGTITPESFKLNLLMFPVIAIGALSGVVIVKYIPDAFYRKFVIAVTLLSAMFLFV